MLKKNSVVLFVVLLIGIMSTLLTSPAANALDYPAVVPYTSHITAYEGTNIDVKLSLFHKYYDERLYVDIYDSKGKVVVSSDDYFDESDADEQIFTFTWLAKKANVKPGEYTLLATMSYYDGDDWRLCPEDSTVAITIKKIPAPKLKSAKNVKGKKITAKWSKVKNATKYQVKIGSKTYSSKKTAYTAKKLKKGKTYKVKVRACMNNKWSKWSNTKKVKIRK